MGFDQVQNTRTYKFDRAAKGEPAARILVSVDLGLFLRHHVGVQEGPTLCAQKLTSDLEKGVEGAHELTNNDLLTFASERADAQANKAARRKPPRRPRA